MKNYTDGYCNLWLIYKLVYSLHDKNCKIQKNQTIKPYRHIDFNLYKDKKIRTMKKSHIVLTYGGHLLCYYSHLLIK
jgi:hypothetical protein